MGTVVFTMPTELFQGPWPFKLRSLPIICLYKINCSYLYFAEMYHYLLTAILQLAFWYSFKFIDIESSTILDFHIGIPFARVAKPMKAHLADYIFSQSHWMPNHPVAMFHNGW